MRLSIATLITIGAVSAGGPRMASAANDVPTFTKDVAPILYRNCVQCHRANDIAPMALTTYEEVRPWAPSIKSKVLSKEIPPWGVGETTLRFWTFEWDVPEGLLGAGGMATGKTVYRKLADGFFEATSEGRDTGGPFSVKETIAYARDDHSISRFIADSRGYSYLQIGHIDGSLGGTYGIGYESGPFIFRGRAYRLQHFVRLISTGHYRIDAKVATESNHWTNYGIWWFRLDIPETRR